MNQHHVGLQLNDAPHPIRQIFGLMHTSFFRNRMDGKFLQSEISEFSVGNMLKKEGLRARKCVIHCFTKREMEFSFFPLQFLPACLWECISLSVCNIAGARVAFFSYFISKFGTEPWNSGRGMEQFDFSIGSCDVIYVMCFSQIPSK